MYDNIWPSLLLSHINFSLLPNPTSFKKAHPALPWPPTRFLFHPTAPPRDAPPSPAHAPDLPQRGWSLCMYVRFWVASWAQKVPPLANQFCLWKLKKLLIVALIRNEAADLPFWRVSPTSEGIGFSETNMSTVCMLEPKVGWCVCMFAYERWERRGKSGQT